MEIANLDTAVVRLATSKDASEIWRLIHEASYQHTHADWHLPGDWLGTPGFVVSEGFSKHGRFSAGKDHELAACLAVGADPPPAAWVRLAAVRRTSQAQELLAVMVDRILPFLREINVTELGWMSVESWPDRWLPQLGFRRLNWITTFLKSDMDTALFQTPEVEVRPVREDEMESLAEIEAAAFDPLWRHSAEGLRLALNYSFCFDVALIDGRIVGFQYSVLNHHSPGAHLVRMTVHPSVQGSGIGSDLMNALIKECRKRGLNRVSLNTQIDNIASHRLYEKFGFYRTGDQMPVWVLTL